MKTYYISLITILVFMAVFFSGCTQNSDIENNDENGNFTRSDENEKTNDQKQTNQYIWSAMNEGPYHDKISYATSTNLLDWADSEKILADHASVPGAVYKDGVIYVYFVDVSQDGIPEQTGLLTSEDNGQNWSEKKYVHFEGVDDKIPVDPAPFLMDDGRIRLYYYDINEGRDHHNPTAINKIYSAISEDGIIFTQEHGVRFQKKGIFDPSIILVNGLWRLYVGDIQGNQIISAVSDNGLDFTEEGIAYVGGIVPEVVYHNGTYYLYTAGIDISVSEDGATFTKSSSSFRSKIGMITADASVIQLLDGTYIMFYKTK